MNDPKAGEKCKISLEQTVVPQGKEVLKNQKDGSTSKEFRANLKEWLKLKLYSYTLMMKSLKEKLRKHSHLPLQQKE